jgi:dipeptidyl aminopeptidase/acylaminoacyl peptidase
MRCHRSTRPSMPCEIRGVIPSVTFQSARILRLACLAGLVVLSGIGLGVLTAGENDDSDASAVAEDILTAHDIARLRVVLAAEISPQGDSIAYVLGVPREVGQEDNGPAWSELHVVDLSGNSRPFVTGHVNVSHVRWTPDGKGISFLARRGDDKETSVYVIPIDGGEARRLLSFATSISSYSWHPDGKQLAFLATEAPDEEKKKLAEKGFNAEFYEEDLQPVKVWLAEADFECTEDPRMLDLPGSASELHFGPDGDRLLVALTDKPLIDYHFMYRRLHVVDVKSGSVMRKIENPGKLGPARWSPSGQLIAFLSGEDINDPSEGRLMVAQVNDGSFREIMPDYPPNVTGIAWHPDGTLRFTADDGCYSTYGQVAMADPERELAIPSGGEVILEGFSYSPSSGNAAFVGSTTQHPSEVFVRVGDELQRLTNSNPWLEEKRLARQDVIRYDARDGEVIEGVLVWPLDHDPEQRYPLILAVHGGPEAHVSNGWVTSYGNPGQTAAARGFAVFYPNYRGSTGRGVAFAKAHQRDAAGKEFDDLVDGVDHLIETGMVDRDKVGVTGGSYGGFATAWCSTRYSDRFAAGVMFVGISNLISKSGTTDIPDEMYHVHHRSRIWEDWQFYLERSPIYHIENARTPLLILHGKDDPRVHPSQSLELYRNLKILDQTPVRLIFYPGEGHGNRKASARLDYHLRLLQWMEHYLQGPGGEPPATQLEYE